MRTKLLKLQSESEPLILTFSRGEKGLDRLLPDLPSRSFSTLPRDYMWVFAPRAAGSCLLVLFGFVGSSRLVEGAPPSGALVAQTIDRTIGIVVAALQGL